MYIPHITTVAALHNTVYVYALYFINDYWAVIIKTNAANLLMAVTVKAQFKANGVS